MDNETYGDVDCIHQSTNIDINNQTFCSYKAPLNLMEYTDNKINEFKKTDYSNDIKLLSDCDQNNVIGEDVIEKNNQLNNNQNLINDLDKLKTNLIICNSKNIFNEISEEEILDNINNIQKDNQNINNDLNNGNDQKLISNEIKNKNLIDKNLISLATEKLLKNSKLEQLGDKPLMQLENLETIFKNKDLNENSKELIEQLTEQIDEQLNNELKDNLEKSGIESKLLCRDENNKQIELIKEQLIERLNEPMIEQISELTNSLLLNNQQHNLKDDTQESKLDLKSSIDNDESLNTPIDSEFSFRYSSNNNLLNNNSCDYEEEEEVFDEEQYDEDFNNNDESYLDRLKRLEEEQESMNSSLIALTSHFANVQLRLKQIVDASPDQKEILLKELEEFAFRAIPDYRLPELDEFNRNTNFNVEDLNDSSNDKSNKLQLQRDKQKELILKLKEQLEDLEKYAYECDPNIIPSSMIMEKQNLIIEELKGKLPLELDKLEKKSPEELRRQIDKAIRDLVNPVIMKEQLVDQLKTQVSDLERFIEFLQEGKICIKSTKKGGLIFDGNVNQLIAKCKCNCTSKHTQECVSSNTKKNTTKSSSDKHGKFNRTSKTAKTANKRSEEDELNDNEKAAKMIRRALALLNMFAFVQFGCNTKSMINKPAHNSNSRFERNILKKTNKINHWGDLRAKLEYTIENLIDLTKQKHLNDSDYTSECEENLVIQTNEKITNTVRKQLCVLLRELLEHGLNSNLNSCVSSDDRVMQNDYSFANWNCFSQKSRIINSFNDRRATIWDIMVHYFYLKKGDQFRQTPARKLSVSFNLNIVGGVPITQKQTLLSCIDEIMDTHTKLKRSADSHWKAFVSRGLNEKRLVGWLKLIFKCKTIVNRFYEPWSYVSSTAFDEGLKSLDRLTNTCEWNLPTDIAIRQLQNINEAF